MSQKRNRPPWSQPTFYSEGRGKLSFAYVRAEVHLTLQDWIDLELIAEERRVDPRRLLAEAARNWLNKEIEETFEEAA